MPNSAPLSDTAKSSPALEVLRSPDSRAPSQIPTIAPHEDLQPSPDSPKRPGLLRRLFGWFTPLFFLTVFLPTGLAIAYFYYLAPDIYISESRFVVRSPQTQASGGLSSLLLSGASMSSSLEDTYTVHEFMNSRDALKVLLDKFPLRQLYGDPTIFALDRFPGLDGDASFEAFYDYFTDHFDVAVDSTTQISTLKVRGFSPETAYKINQSLLEMGEKLVNDLNSRARLDMIKFATTEVSKAEQRIRDASEAISAYRNKTQIYDPVQESQTRLTQIARLRDELIDVKKQRAQIESSSSESIQLKPLIKRAEILNEQIKSETQKIVGDESSLSQQTVEYQRLTLDRGFAEKSLEIALSSLETARTDAQRNQLYLERIAQPSLPDSAQDTIRWKHSLEVFLVGLLAWGIGTMLIAGIREHQN